MKTSLFNYYIFVEFLNLPFQFYKQNAIDPPRRSRGVALNLPIFSRIPNNTRIYHNCSKNKSAKQKPNPENKIDIICLKKNAGLFESVWWLLVQIVNKFANFESISPFIHLQSF